MAVTVVLVVTVITLKVNRVVVARSDPELVAISRLPETVMAMLL